MIKPAALALVLVKAGIVAALAAPLFVWADASQAAGPEWRSCNIEPITADKSGDWHKIIEWARPIIRLRFSGDYRAIALHGMCNVKSHAIILCRAEWMKHLPIIVFVM